MPGPGLAALDRQRRQRRLHDRLAGPAAQLSAASAGSNLERGWNVFEHLGQVLADLAQHRAAAAVAGALRCVRQRARAAGAPAAACGPSLVIPRVCAPRLAGSCSACSARALLSRHAFLEFAEQQFELLDLAVRAFSEERPTASRSQAPASLQP